MEVRAAVRLGHYGSLEDALAHALEVEAARQDHRCHQVRKIVAAPVFDRFKGYRPRCYACGEKGHLRSSCPKRSKGGVNERPQKIRVANSTAYHRSGKSNGNADALSKRPCPEDCKHCEKQEVKESKK
ncbi:unnamed protein product [Arctia plantaginis]|uniref:CCHC-type domain-containing protein n=1 Tax=Arctia plantaginis TaxID=874455 RepID=A0A8S0ZI20_ARCPL|nr:unnamed protein product [Arctia plantaginis]